MLGILREDKPPWARFKKPMAFGMGGAPRCVRQDVPGRGDFVTKDTLGIELHRILAATARPQIAGQGPASLTGLVSDRDFAGAGQLPLPAHEDLRKGVALCARHIRSCSSELQIALQSSRRGRSRIAGRTSCVSPVRRAHGQQPLECPTGAFPPSTFEISTRRTGRGK